MFKNKSIERNTPKRKIAKRLAKTDAKTKSCHPSCFASGLRPIFASDGSVERKSLVITNFRCQKVNIPFFGGGTDGSFILNYIIYDNLQTTGFCCLQGDIQKVPSKR